MAGLTDLTVWLQEKLEQYPDLTEEHLVRVCIIGLVAHFEWVDRNQRLEREEHPGRAAAIWLSEPDVDALMRGLRGQKGAEIRLVRQELQAMFT